MKKLFSFLILAVVSLAQNLSFPPPPVGVTAACFCPVSGASTTYYYWVTAAYPNGKSALTGSGAIVTYALGSGSPVSVSWNAMPGAISYDVLRTTTSTAPTGASAVGIGIALSANNFTDTGITAATYNVAQGAAGAGVNSVQTATDTATITTVQVLGALLNGTPTAAASYTTPTATLLIAGMPTCVVNSTIYNWAIRNTSGGANTITVLAGAGVTLAGTMTVAQNAQRQFLVSPTNCTTPAVTIYAMSSNAF